jgi:hypothetical protein
MIYFDLQNINEFKTYLKKGCPVMQFMGFQDSDGKDIYEGDIMEFDIEYKNPKKPKQKVILRKLKDIIHFENWEIIPFNLDPRCNLIRTIVIGNFFENKI